MAGECECEGGPENHWGKLQRKRWVGGKSRRGELSHNGTGRLARTRSSKVQLDGWGPRKESTPVSFLFSLSCGHEKLGVGTSNPQPLRATSKIGIQISAFVAASARNRPSASPSLILSAPNIPQKVLVHGSNLADIIVPIPRVTVSSGPRFLGVNHGCRLHRHLLALRHILHKRRYETAPQGNLWEYDYQELNKTQVTASPPSSPSSPSPFPSQACLSTRRSGSWLTCPSFA